MASKQTQVPLRLPEDILKRVDQHVERMNREEPGVSFSRADACRSLIVRGLGVVEKTKGK